MRDFKVIFVEGCDGVGKTTFISELKARLFLGEDAIVLDHHFEFPKGTTDDIKYGYQHGQFDLMFEFLVKLKKFWMNFTVTEKPIYVILDRSHIGEYVWGPVYRKKFPIYLPKLEHSYKEKLNCRTILLTCSTDTARQRIYARGEKFNESFELIQTLFRTAVEISPFDSVELSTDIDSPEVLVNKIIEDI